MSTPQPNPYSQPTQWNFNPLANTSNLIDYGDSDTEYASTTQPYGGYSTSTSTVNWRNPTAWSNSLVVGTYQEYYGGPSYVPLYGAPTQWFTNETPDNEAGVYDPSNSAYANLREYDLSNQEYDSSTTGYDGMNGQSFVNWRNPTSWTIISGNRSQ